MPNSKTTHPSKQINYIQQWKQTTLHRQYMFYCTYDSKRPCIKNKQRQHKYKISENQSETEITFR